MLPVSGDDILREITIGISKNLVEEINNVFFFFFTSDTSRTLYMYSFDGHLFILPIYGGRLKFDSWIRLCKDMTFKADFDLAIKPNSRIRETRKILVSLDTRNRAVAYDSSNALQIRI